jgi:trans-2,3-dihydro-3-hydroxyanthranilate isomerase
MTSEPTHPYVILDVFTDTPLQGNPLAVFTVGEAVPETLMQRVARELNLSETVFLLPPQTSEAHARARIFTPSAELPFAGHPVLGSAFVVGERDGVDSVRLDTLAGTISIELVREAGRIVSGEMSQPLPTWAPFPEPEALLGALGAPSPELPIEVSDNGPRFAYVELPDVAALSALAPELNGLTALGHLGVSCFAATGTGSAVRVRMFAPALGVVEDPATGSAAGPLAVHLCRHGRVSFGEEITITQGVEIGRPSTLLACAHGSADAVQRVTVRGAAVLVARGHFALT